MECMLSNGNTVPITLAGSYLLVSIQLTTNAEKLSDYSQQVICTQTRCWQQWNACSINHTTTRIRIQTAGLAFSGTGLCSCRVRGVDGCCAEHLTVESDIVIYTPNSYTCYY